MFTLFWRIFLGFWLSLILLGVAGTWLSESMRDSGKAIPLNPAQYIFIKKLRSRIQKGNIPRLVSRWQKTPPQQPIKKIIVLDSNGNVVGNQPRPDPVNLLLQQSKGQPMLIRSWKELWFGPISMTSRNQSYQLYVNTSNAPFLKSRHWLEHPIARLLIIFLASIAASFLVSLFLVRPIKKLQLAVTTLKTDLNFRVDEKIIRRKDELGKLGQQINSMAETIQKLVNSQQNILWDVSHELRSPLARIATALAIAEQKSEPEKAIQRLNKEVDLLNKMIAQLLLLGRLEAGLQKIQPEPVHLKNLLQQIIDDMRYESKRDFNIELEIQQDFQIQGDPLLLASLFGNILRNSRDHNETTISIKIDAKYTAENCTISIQDDGSGVSRSMQQQLFTPFKRESSNQQGLGLGMAITKNIVALHHGTIEARNLPLGFEIFISLPIKQPD
jgi:signal transduction histidine kinase